MHIQPCRLCRLSPPTLMMVDITLLLRGPEKTQTEPGRRFRRPDSVVSTRTALCGLFGCLKVEGRLCPPAVGADAEHPAELVAHRCANDAQAQALPLPRRRREAHAVVLYRDDRGREKRAPGKNRTGGASCFPCAKIIENGRRVWYINLAMPFFRDTRQE